MANYYEEGQRATGNSHQSDNETVQWLEANKLSHLIPVFENGLSLSELVEMTEKELTEILEAMGLSKIDIVRVRSKILKYNAKPQPPTTYTPPPKHQRVILTEVETAALNSLDNKHKELTAENKSIQDRLSEFEAEYRKQEKFIHDTFNEIQSNIEKRKNILLNEMKAKSDEYRQKLSVHMKSIANQRSILGKIKQKCENDINHSNISTVQQATERANKTRALIDETLLSISLNHKPIVITKGVSITCDIAKREINDNIKTWGAVSIIGHKPPVPAINIVTLYPQSMTIELLTDRNFDQQISKYEVQLKLAKNTHPFKWGGSDAFINDDMKGDEVSVVDIHDENIAFHKFDSLKLASKYQIRARGSTESGTFGEWTEWVIIQTPSQRHPIYTIKPKQLDINQTSLNIDEWLRFCNQKNITLTPYQQRRIFHYLKTTPQQQQQQQMQMKFQNRSRRADPRVSIAAFDIFLCDPCVVDSEWKNMKREVQEKGAQEQMGSIHRRAGRGFGRRNVVRGRRSSARAAGY